MNDNNIRNSYFENFFKDRYHYELDRKDKIEKSITYMMSVIIIICGVSIYFYNNLPSFISIFLTIAFYVFYFLLNYCILVSIYFFIRTYHNYSYGYLPKPKEIEKDINDFKKYYKNKIEEDKILKKVEDEMSNYITSWYIEASEKNTSNNDKKSYFRHMTYNWLIGVLVFLVLSTTIFYIN